MSSLVFLTDWPAVTEITATEKQDTKSVSQEECLITPQRVRQSRLQQSDSEALTGSRTLASLLRSDKIWHHLDTHSALFHRTHKTHLSVHNSCVWAHLYLCAGSCPSLLLWWDVLTKGLVTWNLRNFYHLFKTLKNIRPQLYSGVLSPVTHCVLRNICF